MGCRSRCPCRTPALRPGARGGSSCCVPWAAGLGCCVAGACGAKRGKESELSGVVSSVTSLNKAHVVGRQRIRQDFCRPAGECFCQGFTISINKHAGVAFGVVSSDFPGSDQEKKTELLQKSLLRSRAPGQLIPHSGMCRSCTGCEHPPGWGHLSGGSRSHGCPISLGQHPRIPHP